MKGNDTNGSGDTTVVRSLCDFYSVVTDLALRTVSGRHRPPAEKTNSQVPGEVDVESILHGQVVAQELQGNDIEQSLQTVDGPWNADRLRVPQESRVVVVVANDHRSCLSRSDLRKRGLDFGEERIPGHDNDDRHVFIDQRERAVLEFSGKDTCVRVSVLVEISLDIDKTYPPNGGS